MDYILKIFYDICSIENDQFFLLLKDENINNSGIYFLKNENEIYNKIKEYGESKKISSIYLNKDISKTLKDKIINKYNIIINIPDKFRSNNDYDKDSKYIKFYKNNSEVYKFTLLLKNEPLFSNFLDKYFGESYNRPSIIKKLKNDNIININELAYLTDLGKILFSNENDIVKCRIINISLINNFYYKKNNEFRGSLLLLKNDIFNYVNSYNPTIQDRSNIKSTKKKLFDEKLLREIIKFALCNCNYSEPLIININSTFIEFIFDKITNLNRLKIIKKYINFLDLENIKDEAQKHNLQVSYNKNILKISIVKKIDNSILLDNDDLTIIDIAKQNKFFTRKMIDLKLNISPRSSNKKINRLISLGFIKSIDTGKNIKYELTED